MKNLIFVSVILLVILVSSIRAQEVTRWDVCEDTSFMLFESSEGLSAASPSDLAEIAGKIWDSFPSRTVVRNSTDEGKTWKQLFRNTGWTDKWYSIAHPTHDSYVITGDSLYPVGYDLYRHHAYLLLSSDGGVTWRRQYWDTNTAIRCLRMLNENYGIAILDPVGNVKDSLPDLLPSRLLVTHDGWNTWTSSILQPSQNFYQLICLAPGVFAGVAYHGYVRDQYYSSFWKTTNSGISWDSITLLPSTESLCFVGQNLGWGAAKDWSIRPPRSLIIHTSDGGMTWMTQLDSDMSVLRNGDGVFQIAFGDSLHGFAVGNRILETSDGGVTWKANKPPFEVLPRDGAGNGANGGLKGLIMPSPALALFTCGGPVLRFSGKYRLDAPVLNSYEYGPKPIEPITVSWSRIKGADLYRVQLATSSSAYGTQLQYFDVVDLDTMVRDTFFAFTPKPECLYYARVQAIAEGNNSDWRWNADWDGIGVMFKTVKRIGAALPPHILTPIIGSHTTDNNVLVTWNAVSGALLYHVVCRWDGWSLIDDLTTPDTFTNLLGLSYATQYQISVTAMLADDTTDAAYTSVLIDAQLGVRPKREREIQVYPNPTRDIVHLELPEDHVLTPEVLLFDELGRTQPNVMVTQESTGLRLDVRSLPPGIYSLQVGSHRAKLSVVH